MDTVVIREKLHEYINTADDQHISEMYIFMEGNMQQHNDSIYDEATMNMLYQRMENHNKGISKSYSVEESFNIIRQHRR